MCVAIAGFTAAQVGAATSAITAIGSAMLSIRGQQVAAKAQRQAQAAATERARQKHLADITASRVKQGMENEVLTQQLVENTKRAEAARATAATSAIENNKSGVSVNAMLADYTRQEGDTAFGLVRQAQFGNISRDFGLEQQAMAFSNEVGNINKPIAQPNYGATLLGLANTATGIYSQYQTNVRNELQIGALTPPSPPADEGN